MRGGARIRSALFAGVAAVAAGLALIAYAFDISGELELDAIDARFDIRGTEPAPEDIVFVKIDDVTFNELGVRFQDLRPEHAEAIEILAADGARVIAYDVQFTEESEDPEADAALVEATRTAGNVVLATTEVGENGETAIFGGGEGLEYSRGTPANSNLPNDDDGTIRHMAYELDGLESFAVVTAEKATGRAIDPDQFDDGEAWIDFLGPPGTVRDISFSRVVQEKFEPGTFRDKIVVVGARAPSLQDLHDTATSGEAKMPGPEVHANAIRTALNGFDLDDSPVPIDVALIVLLGLAAPAASLRFPPLAALGFAVALGAIYLVAAQLLFDRGTIIPVAYPIAALALATVGALVAHYVTAAFERERVRDLFSRFVPENVVDDVLANTEGLRLGGVQREGTVMFSDLRGFTSFAEALPVERVIEVLNRYLSEMSDAILDHGGTLVAYMGDGIMAVFGAPIAQDDHADRALTAGQEMLSRMEGFNDWLREQGLGDGFKMGIGLNSGPVMSGNVGSERRLEYTAIGDTTNTASRIEGMTKGTPYQLFLADSTRVLLREPPPELDDAGEREVRGREAGIRLWGLT